MPTTPHEVVEIVNRVRALQSKSAQMQKSEVLSLPKGVYVRVVLHGVVQDDSSSEYKTLHTAMEKNFKRTVFVGGKEFHLPSATYFISAEFDAKHALEKAAKAALTTGREFSAHSQYTEETVAVGLEPVTTK